MNLFTRKRKRARLIKEIIDNAVRTGIGPPPEFFTASELEELQKAVRRADEYDSLFATIEYPERLQERREIQHQEGDDFYGVEQLPW